MSYRLIAFLVFDVLLVLICTTAATNLPYTPTHVLLSEDDNNSTAWIFSSQSSSNQLQLLRLDVSHDLETSNVSPTIAFSSLPFQNGTNNTSYTPVVDSDGTITVLSGDCASGFGGAEVWQFVLDQTKQNGTWSKSTTSQVSTGPSPYGVGFLSSGIIYPEGASTVGSDVYIFGGMCPNTASVEEATWTSAATYSNQMLALSSTSTTTSNSNEVGTYQIALSAIRGAPIAEAGLTMTPLIPTYANSSSSNSDKSSQQNFVLIGGHTQKAFINMSQVALFSLPEQSWAFVGVDQPSGSAKRMLTLRSTADTTVEPRSGHTAILSEDGSKIIVLGGWVGDLSTPATPQLVVLELGSGYGGSGDWAWTIPSTSSSPLSSNQGLYGHGAAMLPGGVMLVTGGYSIPASGSTRRRQSSSTPTTNTNTYLFNTTSNTWLTSYTNPSSSSVTSSSSAAANSSGLNTTSQKVGLSTGLVVGASSLAGLCAVYLWYSRRLRRRREAREKELYDLALNAARYHTDTLPPGLDGRGGGSGSYPEMQEHQPVGTIIKRKPVPLSPYPWAPVANAPLDSRDGQDDLRDAERTGLLVEIPSPTRGLRRSLHGRGPPSSNYGRGGIHTIDERGEYEDSLSGKRLDPDITTANQNHWSDPFKDPPPQLNPAATPLNRTPSEAKRQRTAEIQGWVEDWSAAAAGLDLSRNASATNRSQSQSHSNSHSHSHSNSNSGRGSPDKSDVDRTASNLSEASMYSAGSLQRSNIGTIRRDGSMRSLSAGYAQALFAGAAAAMGKVYHNGSAPQSTIRTTDPRRAASESNLASSATRNLPSLDTTVVRPSTANSQTRAAESKALLHDYNTNLLNNARPEDIFATPPESPVKERALPLRPPAPQYAYSSLLPSVTTTDFSPASDSSYYTRNGSRRTALGFLGSVKRALTGTAGSYSTNNPQAGSSAGGTVMRRVQELESRSSSSSPTKRSQYQQQEYHSTRTSPTKDTDLDGRHPPSPRRSASASATSTFWRGRKGRRDWDESETERQAALERRGSGGEDGEEEWDVERAVEGRLVQVMFTVPKERLRVVNADENEDEEGEVEDEKGEARDHG